MWQWTSWLPRRGRATRAAEPGNAALEAALLAPLLAGTLEFGRLMYAYQAVVDAAREGARLGMDATVTDAQVEVTIRRPMPTRSQPCSDATG